MRGLMMDMPLMISNFIQYAADYHGDVEIVAREIDETIFRYDYREAHLRAKKLAQALERLGVKQGERVGSLAWNTHRHFEMFYGVPGMGGVLHTINPRLFQEQIVYIINHCEDKWLFCDLATLPILEAFVDQLTTIEGFCIMADEQDMPAETKLNNVHCYETLLAAEDGDYQWPEFDENSASTICYTSGTTGNPKGVVYSHRAAFLQTLNGNSADFMGGYVHGAIEVMMPMSPMFHGNAWNFPFSAPSRGAKLVLPGRSYEPDKLVELLVDEEVTVTCGVPTFWLILLDYLGKTGKELPKLRASLSSGTAPPRWMVETMLNDYGVELINTWGMTEALGGSKGSLKPGDGELPPQERMDKLMKSGRGLIGIRHRIIDDDGNVLPWDGQAQGNFQIKGPWITSAYFKDEGGAAVDADGWLITGDVAVIEPDGYVTLKDRSKDVIKSGGEWISSQEIENIAVGHAEIAQAAVIGVAHPKWQERPLLVCTKQPGAKIDREGMLSFLDGKFARWWMPDDVQFVDEIPLTATGKVHKVRIRKMFEDYKLPELN